MLEGQKGYLNQILIGIIVTVLGGLILLYCQDYLQSSKLPPAPEKASIPPLDRTNNGTSTSKPVIKSVPTLPQKSIGTATSKIDKPAPVTKEIEATKKTAVRNKYIAESQEFIFQIKGFKRLSNGLQINLTVMTKDEDRKININGGVYRYSTKFFDQDNNEYRVRQMTIANKNNTGANAIHGFEILKNRAVNLSLTFPDVKESAVEVSLLKIAIGDKDEVQFRDIEIK